MRRPQPLEREPQRIDAGIAGDGDLRRIDPLGAQVGGRAAGRAEMPARQPVGGDAIELFRKGRAQITGAQARLDVREWNVDIEGRERRHQHGRGIALGDHHVRLMLCDHRSMAGRRAAVRVVRVRDFATLMRVVGRNAEPFQRLFGELGVLAGTQGRHLRMRRKLKNDGRHLDRFGPGSDHAQKSLHPAANSPRKFRSELAPQNARHLYRAATPRRSARRAREPHRVPRGFRTLFRWG